MVWLLSGAIAASAVSVLVFGRLGVLLVVLIIPFALIGLLNEWRAAKK
ncbi:MAG: hypothetical protein ACE37B_20580 [Ilumatobacter sp.]